MPLSLVSHFSLSFPYHCTGINESWLKQGTQKNKRDRESEREMRSVVGGYFSKAKDKYGRKCNVSCVDKGGKKKKSKVATYLKINSWL